MMPNKFQANYVAIGKKLANSYAILQCNKLYFRVFSVYLFHIKIQFSLDFYTDRPPTFSAVYINAIYGRQRH